MTTSRQFVVPHIVDFDPQVREAFLTIESYLAELADVATTGAGIHWWDGNGDPNGLPLPNARGGDFFIDRLTGNVYRKVATPYTRSLGGAENESRATDGSMWWDGTAAPGATGTPYRVQDYWLNTTTADIWVLG
jgi:hypothetical protein